MASDFNVSYEKMCHFVSFPLFPLFCFISSVLAIKPVNFDIESHSNAAIFFDHKKMMSDFIMSCQTLSDLEFWQ